MFYLDQIKEEDTEDELSPSHGNGDGNGNDDEAIRLENVQNELDEELAAARESLRLAERSLQLSRKDIENGDGDGDGDGNALQPVLAASSVYSFDNVKRSWNEPTFAELSGTTVADDYGDGFEKLHGDGDRDGDGVEHELREAALLHEETQKLLGRSRKLRQSARSSTPQQYHYEADS